MGSARPRRYSVYILGSLSGTLYIGITSNLPFRVRQHKEHTFRGFTAKYEVDRLLYYETYGEVSRCLRPRVGAARAAPANGPADDGAVRLLAGRFAPDATAHRGGRRRVVLGRAAPG